MNLKTFLPRRKASQCLIPLFIWCVCPLLQGSPARAETSATLEAEEKAWPDPLRYDAVISGYEANTTAPQGAIVGYGSSSMKGWHKTIHEDLAPLPVVGRGFGGSNMNDALFFMDRAITPLKPRAVLLYEGDNDVAGGYSTDRVVGKYREFVTRLHSAVPGARVYVISIKPSPSRWKFWPAMQEVNDQLKQLAASDPLVTYIDVATPMLNEEGKPRPEIFLTDNLHMNRQGYEIWRDAIRPVLMADEAGTSN